MHSKLLSPVQDIHDEFFSSKGLQLFIKRDDMIHPFISGNKWRKLKYIIEDAKEQQKDRLVTFGGAFSNHLLATACAGAVQGFKTTGFVRGEEAAGLNETLLLCRMFGMRLIYISREEYKDQEACFDNHFGENKSAYYIPEGGALDLAVQGCAELADELEEPYTHVFAAAGTGTTLAGIATGMAAKYASCKVEGIAVLKASGYLELQMELYAPGLQNWTIHHEFTGAGYAKADQTLLNWIAAFSARTGVLLDPVYTGKMMQAIYQLAQSNYFPSGSRILAVHTGGLLGTFGYKKEFFR